MAAAALRADGGHTHTRQRAGSCEQQGARKARSPARRHVFHVMGQASSAAAAGGRRVGAASCRSSSKSSVSLCLSVCLIIALAAGHSR